ncbi:MAG: tetratricopeptide repeat protein [Treponema sp.]|jgi:tetratricopeptide (TPR) repeat protein|nr:tetratricopeptide repeat protein [Treponema sp.]
MTDYDREIAEANAALQRNPKDPTAYFNRALAYSGKGDYDQAIEDYTAAIQIPEYASVYRAEAYNNRGRLYNKQGKREQAIADFQMAADLDPGNEMYRENLGGMGVAVKRNTNSVAGIIGAVIMRIFAALTGCSLFYGISGWFFSNSTFQAIFSVIGLVVGAVLGGNFLKALWAALWAIIKGIFR